MDNKSHIETNDEVIKRYQKIDNYGQKLKYRAIISIMLLIISCIFLYFGFNRQNTYLINKTEKGITDYKVYMNKDSVYTKDYQKPGLSYISSTIDYIKVNFDYKLNYNMDITNKYDYEVKSILTIREPGDDNKILFEEEYQEMDKKSNLISQNDLSLNEEINIDYKKYNHYVENYKKNYGVSVNADIKTVMYIYEKSYLDEKEVFSEVRELNITIPLGEQTLSISVNNPIDYTENLTGETKLKFNYVLLCIGIILLLFSLVCVTKTLILLFKYKKLRTIYDIKLDKLLREYDRIIVETDNTQINQEFRNIISVNEFEELIDVRDNTEQPILFIEGEIGKHASFMVINGDTLYIYDFCIDRLK